MLKGVIGFCLLLLAASSQADDVYICNVNGNRVYQGTPCETPEFSRQNNDQQRREQEEVGRSQQGRGQDAQAREAEFREAQQIFADVEHNAENCGRALLSLNGFNKDQLCSLFLERIGRGSSFDEAGRFVRQQMENVDFARRHEDDIEKMWAQQGRISHNLYLLHLYGNVNGILQLRVPGRLNALGVLGTGN